MSDIQSPELDYFMNDEFNDVVFIVEGQPLPANRFILSFKSKVFRAMFSDNFKESKDKEVVIKDTTFDAFKTLIQFFYSEQLVLKDGNDFKLIDDVYKISDRYEGFRLFDKMAEHMKTLHITRENVELFSRVAERSLNKELNEKVIAFIDHNFNDFITKDDKQLIELNDSTHNHLLKVLANNYRNIKQELTNISDKLNTFSVYKCKLCPRMELRSRCYRGRGIAHGLSYRMPCQTHDLSEVKNIFNE